VLGPEHPDTLISAVNLARSLGGQGKHTEAETMHRETLVIQRRVLGPEHPGTLASAESLAIELKAQRRYSEAETMYHDVLVVRRRVLGREHPHTLAAAGPGRLRSLCPRHVGRLCTLTVCVRCLSDMCSSTCNIRKGGLPSHVFALSCRPCLAKVTDEINACTTTAANHATLLDSAV
jgi:hypothetical protein